MLDATGPLLEHWRTSLGKTSELKTRRDVCEDLSHISKSGFCAYVSPACVPFLHESPSEFNGKSIGNTDIWPPYIRNFVIISRTEEEFDKGFSNSLKQN